MPITDSQLGRPADRVVWDVIGIYSFPLNWKATKSESITDPFRQLPNKKEKIKDELSLPLTCLLPVIDGHKMTAWIGQKR